MNSQQTETEKPNPSSNELRRARGIAVVLAVSILFSILCCVYALIKKEEAEKLRQLTLELRVEVLETKEAAENALQEAKRQEIMAFHSYQEAMRALEKCSNKK